MFRLTQNLQNLKLVQPLTQNYQSVRNFPRKPRKPFWMPTAKSKLFRIPPRPVLPPEEVEELKRLSNNYRTQIKTIRRYLTYKYNVQLLERSDTEQIERQFVEDFKRCNEINNEWNEQIRIERDRRLQQQLEEDLKLAELTLQKKLEKQEQWLMEAEEMVRREKEASKSFITPENLDEAIEYAMRNPVDYNFAIDLDGNRIDGRDTGPTQQEVIKQ